MVPGGYRTWGEQVAASARATVASARARAATGRFGRLGVAGANGAGANAGAGGAAGAEVARPTPSVLAGVVREGETWSPPWQSLPSDLSERLAPAIPDLVETVIRIVPDQVPAYAGARDGGYRETLRLGVSAAFGQLLRLPGTDLPALEEPTRELMASLGAAEYREGRSMDALLGAYRTAARIAFRELSAECVRQEMQMQVVVDLGESIWAYIDELSSVSAQAYAAEQTSRAGLLELHRAQLAVALLTEGATRSDLQRLARQADMALPRQMDVVVVPVSAAEALRERLGGLGLLVEREDAVVALLAADDVPDRRHRLGRLLRGIAAVVGERAAWDGVPHSYDVARSLMGTMPQEASGETSGETLDEASGKASRSRAEAPMFAEDHLGRVVLTARPRVLAQLGERLLAPLEGLSDAKRDVLTQTLLAWLQHWGRRAEIAEHLGVHPQTVGYRVGRLRELFGPALDDPDVRFDLEMVLRAERDATGPAPVHPNGRA